MVDVPIIFSLICFQLKSSEAENILLRLVFEMCCNWFCCPEFGQDSTGSGKDRIFCSLQVQSLGHFHPSDLPQLTLSTLFCLIEFAGCGSVFLSVVERCVPTSPSALDCGFVFVFSQFLLCMWGSGLRCLYRWNHQSLVSSTFTPVKPPLCSRLRHQRSCVCVVPSSVSMTCPYPSLYLQTVPSLSHDFVSSKQFFK